MAIAISVEGLDSAVAAEPGDTILDALINAGVPFPYACATGDCGTCKCVLLDGDIFELEHSAQALAPEERARRVILACRAQVRGDIRVRRIGAKPLAADRPRA